MKKNKFSQSSQQKTISSFFKIKEPLKATTNLNTECPPAKSKDEKLSESVIKKSSVTPRKRKLVLREDEKSPAKRKSPRLKVSSTPIQQYRRSPRKHVKSLLTSNVNVPALSIVHDAIDEVDQCCLKPPLSAIQTGSELPKSEINIITKEQEFMKSQKLDQFDDSLDEKFLDSFITPDKTKSAPNTSPVKRNVSPVKVQKNFQKSPGKEIQNSPNKNDKLIGACSPLKPQNINEFKNEPLNFSELSSCFNDSFEDDYLGSIFNLCTPKRCKVIDINYNSEGNPILELKCLEDSSNGSCVLLFPWSGLRITVGDVLSVKAEKNEDGSWTTGGENSMVVQHSDVLISGTAVVGSLFCRRRSVINHLFKETVGSGGQATAMFVGTIVHDLLQKTLMKKLKTKEDIEALYKDVISSKEFIKKMFLENIEPSSILENISLYLPKIVEFIQQYVSPANISRRSNEGWSGEISEVRDIEENIWAPPLGIKGKIDATVQVKIHSKTKIMPLELKTGKASFSAEHRGQVILYTMMLSHLGIKSDSGLLLYLKEGKMKEIVGGVAERRDLIMLRNQLASSIMETNRVKDSLISPPSLPPVINHHSACSKCPQLPICSLFLRKDGGVNEENPLSKLAPESTSHLSDAHVDYIFTWLNLLLIEANQARTSQPIWALSIKAREEGGTCLVDLKVCGPVEWQGLRCSISLSHVNKSFIKQGVVSVGQFIIVSTDSQVAVSMGTVAAIHPGKVDLLLDRDISKLKGPFFIDRYESNSSITITAGFLSLLLENSDKASSLRKHIIDLQLPTFSKKLSSRVKLLGQEVFAKLNKQQVRAILQVLSADSYILIKGMPGTGKTRTLSALVELLVLLGKSVIVTSHTHSAVDNILLCLPKFVMKKVMRLGGAKRVHPSLLHLTEDSIVEKANCASVDELNKLYDSKTVMGVTCLSGSHRAISRKRFDYCIVDEATQVCQPEIIATIFQAEKFVLIGDPQQLPPLVISHKAKEGGMAVSLLERLDRPAVSTCLSLQYRMNSVITSLANSFTYGGLLKCGDESVASAVICLKKKNNLTSWLVKVMSDNISDSVILLDIKAENTDGNRCTINNAEAAIVFQIVSSLKEAGISGEDVGVISPYRAQVLLLESKLSSFLKDIEVNTVDQYQGRDKSVIIYSATRSTPMSGSDILGDVNRLTVAITRAKHKLIIIGDVDILNTYPNFQKLLSFINPENIIKCDSVS